MARLIDADRLKEYINDGEACHNCPDRNRLCDPIGCQFPDALTPQWERVINEQPTVKADTERLYTAHQVAEILTEAFCDTCACNYGDISEWLPEKCDFANTSCPDPGGVACWEQWLKNRNQGGYSEVWFNETH